MKKIILLFSLCLLGIPPAILPKQTLPRINVQIQVEFKRAGYTTQGSSGNRRGYRSLEKQFLVVSDGLEGRIFVGKQVPYGAWYRDYLLKEGYVSGDIQFLSVGTKMVVEPRVVGSQVMIQLTPEISYQTSGGWGNVAVTKLSTTVVAEDGQPIRVGAIERKSEFENYFYQESSGEAVEMILTPHIVNMS